MQVAAAGKQLGRKWPKSRSSRWTTPWALAIKKSSSIFQAALGNVSPAQRHRHRGVRAVKGTKVWRDWSPVIWGGLFCLTEAQRIFSTSRNTWWSLLQVKRTEPNSTHSYSGQKEITVTEVFYKAHHLRKVIPSEFIASSTLCITITENLCRTPRDKNSIQKFPQSLICQLLWKEICVCLPFYLKLIHSISHLIHLQQFIFII